MHHRLQCVPPVDASLSVFQVCLKHLRSAYTKTCAWREAHVELLGLELLLKLKGISSFVLCDVTYDRQHLQSEPQQQQNTSASLLICEP